MRDSNFVTVVFQGPRQMSRKFDFVLDHENSHTFKFTIAPDGPLGHTRTTPQYESYSTEKWIYFLFRSDPCRWPVAGKDGDVVSERKYFFLIPVISRSRNFSLSTEFAPLKFIFTI